MLNLINKWSTYGITIAKGAHVDPSLSSYGIKQLVSEQRYVMQDSF